MTKQSLGYHTRKRVCHKPTNFVCEYCDRELSSRSSLHRHKKTCKSKPDDTITKLEEMKKIMEELQRTHNELERRVSKYERKNIQSKQKRSKVCRAGPRRTVHSRK